MSNLQNLQQRAREIQEKYRALDGRDGHTPWTGVDYAAGFACDVGDLIKLVMAKDGKRRGDNIDSRSRNLSYWQCNNLY